MFLLEQRTWYFIYSNIRNRTLHDHLKIRIRILRSNLDNHRTIRQGFPSILVGQYDEAYKRTSCSKPVNKLYQVYLQAVDCLFLVVGTSCKRLVTNLTGLLVDTVIHNNITTILLQPCVANCVTINFLSVSELSRQPCNKSDISVKFGYIYFMVRHISLNTCLERIN